MTDVVRILEQYANAQSMKFVYGRMAVLNLIDTGEQWSGEKDDIYFLLEYRKIKPIKNQSQTNIKGTRFEGVFYLVKHSDLDQNFFNEVGTEQTSKYVNNIEPLIDYLHGLENYFACTDISFETVEADDVTDLLDANADGLMVKFSAFIPVTYILPNNGGSSSI